MLIYAMWHIFKIHFWESRIAQEGTLFFNICVALFVGFGFELDSSSFLHWIASLYYKTKKMACEIHSSVLPLLPTSSSYDLFPKKTNKNN